MCSCICCTPIDGQQQRQELYHAIAAAQKKLEAAQRRRGLAARDLTRAKTELDRLKASTKASKAAKQRLTDAATAEANWVAARPHAPTLLAMAAGPLTPEVRQAYIVRVALYAHCTSFRVGTQAAMVKVALPLCVLSQVRNMAHCLHRAGVLCRPLAMARWGRV
jgi:hypothetical protein